MVFKVAALRKTTWSLNCKGKSLEEFSLVYYHGHIEKKTRKKKKKILSLI